MSSHVYILATGKSKSVKNLGWLLRNSHKVAIIELFELPEGRGKIIATLTERGVPTKEYRSSFESFEIMQKLIRRPCLSHVITTLHKVR